MNKTDLAKYSAYLAMEYYRNNTRPFLDAFSEKCLWVGPAKGQMIHSKKALLDAFAKERNQLTFALQNMRVIPTPVNSTSLDVLLTYSVVTYYPGGESIIFQQRTEMLWVEESAADAQGVARKAYKIRVCHISNEYPYDARDTIYPNHFAELDIAKLYTGRISQCKFSLKGLNSSYFYLSGDAILWAATKGSHTLIHTANDAYESSETLASIVKKYPDTLYQVHASYAVNPMYVASIGRFYLQMDDGQRISIPEKKYTKTRNEINRRIEALKKP